MSEATVKKTSPHDALPTSWPVQYWQNGQPATSLPQVALVSRNCGNGMIYLLSFGQEGGTAICRRNVYHVSSQELRERPGLASQYGVWDYVPGLVPTPPAEPEEPAAATDETLILRVLEMHEAGTPASEIARNLRTKKTVIEAIIKEHASETAGATV